MTVKIKLRLNNMLFKTSNKKALSKKSTICFNNLQKLGFGTASKSLLHTLEVRLNRVLRIITSSSIHTPINYLYSSLNTLKLIDIYHLELGKFMYQLYNNKLPVVFTECFNKIKNVHDHLTRQSKNFINNMR